MPPEPGHRGPEDQHVVQPERPREVDGCVDLHERLRPGGKGKHHRERAHREAPGARPRREEHEQHGGEPLHARGERPQGPAHPRPAELRDPHRERQQQRDVAGVERRGQREQQHDDRDRRREWPPTVGPLGRPQEQQHVRATPDHPRHVPGKHGPGQEERQHPRRIHVGQEHAARVVRIPAPQPDADPCPVRARVGPGRLSAGHQERDQQPAGDAEQEDGQQAPAIAQAGQLPAEGAAVHAGPAAGRPGQSADERVLRGHVHDHVQGARRPPIPAAGPGRW